MLNKDKALKLLKHERELQFISQVYRNIGVFFAKPLVKTRVTPTQISILSILTAIFSAYFLSQGDYLNAVIGAIIFQISIILDRMDGSLARRKNMETTFGKWIEYNSDVITDAIVILGATFGLFLQTNNNLVLILGMLFITVRFFIVNLNTALFVCLDSPSDLFEKEVKNKFLTQLIPTRTFVFLFFTIFIIFNKLFEFFILMNIYLALFFFTSLVYLSMKIWKKEYG